MAQCALTTVDNPYDPFTQTEAWYRFDEDNALYFQCPGLYQGGQAVEMEHERPGIFQ